MKFKPRGRIYGGNYTNIRAHPWYTFITGYKLDGLSKACGAALIGDPKLQNASRFVVTAGHCIDE